ncbi:O-Antigen ligase [Caulifigura coniformis]|uniref:O-Antigen ligase n=1 Tax=Caulifigura coniformis TaxID=2527983 RepID=A0A517S9U5_9PLAN|nr:O-antigen ligase family protein [Caulifigura coniformis]QDT52856.1 O-Antigen ligase [Caulifigura coniformis]
MARPRKTPVLTSDEPPAQRGWLPLLDIVGLVLIAIRWFTPTEGTFQGDTLWISQLWLGWGVLASWSALRQQVHWTKRGGLWAWGLGLIAAGHVVAGVAVMATEGQKRSALNGLWEWVSLALAAVWFHHRASSSGFRRTFRITLIASAVGLSALGIWQRWVSHPALGQAVIEFDELESKVPSLEGSERRQAETRLRALERTLGEYRSLDANGRRAMRQRLLESSEPLGRFALTNSLAALLLVGLILSLGEAFTLWQAGGRSTAQGPADPHVSKIVLTIAALLIAFVLLLTKSRTAWGGCLAGGMTAAVVGTRGRWKSVIGWGVVAAGAMAVLVAATWAAGGLDRLVLTEAPKSLEYRTEYWIGAWRVIQQHPWIGIGPGNFRQHYLAHKLAKSSEEVLDPHNFLLEAWATSGLAGIAGLVLLIVACLTAFRRPLAGNTQDAGGGDWRSSAPAIVFGAGGLLSVVALYLGGQADWELIAASATAVLAAIGLNRTTASGSVLPVEGREIATQAAWCGLSVHLLGAGGMEMPAIFQLWLCLSSLIVAPRAALAAAHWPAWLPGAALAICGLAFFGQFATATIPSLNSRSLTDLAFADSMTGRRPDLADRQLSEAAAADPHDPTPWRHRAQLAFQQWTRTRDGEWFDRAIEYQHEVIRRDPRHAHDYRALADLHLKRFAVDQRPQDAEAAIEATKKALILYPNQLASRQLLADALVAAGRGEEARAAARSTLELDALWLKLGHYDKVLTPDVRERMKALAGEPE